MTHFQSFKNVPAKLFNLKEGKDMNRKKFLPLIAVLLIALLAPVISGAQGETILTVAVPQWMADQMKDAFADFEAAHPGVKVVIKGVEQSFYAAPPFSEMDE